MSSNIESNFHQNNLSGPNSSPGYIFSFHEFRFDAKSLMLYRLGVELPLTPKEGETLLALLERHGEIVGKDWLIARLWGDTTVEEANLVQNVYKLRKVLGETMEGRPMIETFRRRGYRFNGNVRLWKNKDEDPVQTANSQNDLKTGASNGIVGTPEIERPVNAYHAWQLAKYHFQLVMPVELVRARANLNEALQFNPDFGPAYSALAELAVTEATVGMRPITECSKEAKKALGRAAEIDPNSADYHAAAGFVDLICDWNFEAAENKLRHSIALNEHYVYSNCYLGQVFMFQGRHDEAEFYLRKAVEMEPMGIYIRNILTMSYFLARDYEKVLDEAGKILAVYPNFFIAKLERCWALEQMNMLDQALFEYDQMVAEPFGEIICRWVGYAYAKLGDRDRALDTVAKMLPENRALRVSLTHLAALYSGLNDAEKGINFLKDALAERDPWMLWVKCDPRFDGLRSHPQFAEILQNVGVQA